MVYEVIVVLQILYFLQTTYNVTICLHAIDEKVILINNIIDDMC